MICFMIPATEMYVSKNIIRLKQLPNLFFFFIFTKISTSARRTQITVTLMPTVPTPKDHSTALVIRDIPEMESRV